MYIVKGFEVAAHVTPDRKCHASALTSAGATVPYYTAPRDDFVSSVTMASNHQQQAALTDWEKR